MKKNKVKFEELLAGALLKFSTVSSLDMTLLMGGISKIKNVKFEDSEVLYMKDFIQINGNIFSLKEGLTLETNINYGSRTITLREWLELLQGNIVNQYLDNMDLDDFVLRKIKLAPSSLVAVSRQFNQIQQKILKKLYYQRYICTKLHLERPRQSCLVVKITKLGELQLFLKANEEKIEHFSQDLRSLKYDTGLLKDFLMTQDLNDSPNRVLSLTKFHTFYDDYKHRPSSRNKPKQNYKRRTHCEKTNSHKSKED